MKNKKQKKESKMSQEKTNVDVIKEMIEKYSITTCNNDQNIQVDKSIGKYPSDVEFVKKHKFEIINLIQEMEEAEIKNQLDNLRNSRLSLSYYFGDWYRANSIFDVETRKQPDWGDIENPFTIEVLNDVCGRFGFANDEKMTKNLEKYFSVNLNTTLHDVSKKYPDLTFEVHTYNDMRGKGEYISEIIFPSFSVFEKYLLLAFSDEIRRKDENEKRIAELTEKARQTGQKQLLLSYSTECDHSVLECSVDIISVFIDANGEKEYDRVHTF
jgi:hypothetical protein